MFPAETFHTVQMMQSALKFYSLATVSSPTKKGRARGSAWTPYGVPPHMVSVAGYGRAPERRMTPFDTRFLFLSQEGKPSVLFAPAFHTCNVFSIRSENIFLLGVSEHPLQALLLL